MSYAEVMPDVLLHSWCSKGFVEHVSLFEALLICIGH